MDHQFKDRNMDVTERVPVIDLFAGPGGLGEGFSSFTRGSGESAFDVRLSIEKDAGAHSTLRLRSFFRQFPRGGVPEQYYDSLRQADVPLNSRLEQLYGEFPEEAKAAESEAWLAELGKTGASVVRERLSNALADSENWVLLGGPPCQAYSLVGRSRNRGNEDYRAEKDHRQFLYLEYLQVLADHSPAIFVMENVKGLLSATVQNKRVFQRIFEDLQEPSTALQREGREIHNQRRGRDGAKYRLFPIVAHGRLIDDFKLSDFVVKMERYGVPQARHRIIVLGVREDIAGTLPRALLFNSLKQLDSVSVRQVLNGLPPLRSGLSKEPDAATTWIKRICEGQDTRWFKARTSRDKAGEETFQLLKSSMEGLCPQKDRGGEFVSCEVSIDYRPDWYIDPRIQGTFNHSTRGHIVKDLWRYIYAACFAEVHDRSPNLVDFPAGLLPKHKNVSEAMNGSQFSDRFRVQKFRGPSTTVTSHISKDGHYYIHPDPTQCRSLTVREAARLQTFPDNYFFTGPRTSQYVQVGNAVPPLLASQIAELSHGLLEKTGVIA
jgi:DNA (cytosine-5)-methyltransferase 1